MRENTRCEVEEPMSTPTLRRRISSSSSRLRLTLLKNILPPASLIEPFLLLASFPRRREPMARRICHAMGSRLRGNDAPLFDRRQVPVRVHPVDHAVLAQRGLVLVADERVLHPVRDRGPDCAARTTRSGGTGLPTR